MEEDVGEKKRDWKEDEDGVGSRGKKWDRKRSNRR